MSLIKWILYLLTKKTMDFIFMYFKSIYAVNLDIIYFNDILNDFELM